MDDYIYYECAACGEDNWILDTGDPEDDFPMCWNCGEYLDSVPSPEPLEM